MKNKFRVKEVLIPYVHFHWDYEWYNLSEEYNVFLVDVVKDIIRLLKEGTIDSFTFDGQYSILEDYLRLYPEHLPVIAELVKNGKLEIGPWYIQPDLYSISGESIVRNLLIGILESEKHGNYLRVGYVPDSFGHPPQMPQIMRGFDIYVYVFSRGYPLDLIKYGSEFIWEAPDGSRVYAFYLPLHYNIGYELGLKTPPYDPWLVLKGLDGEVSFTPSIYFKTLKASKEDIRRDLYRIVDELWKYTRTGIILLPIGSDHSIVRRDIGLILKIIKDEVSSKKQAGFSIGLNSLNKYLNSINVNSLKIYRGELRSARYRVILWGTISSRITLKQLNNLAERLLISYVEPLSVVRAIFYNDDLRSYLRNLWKILLKSQFHDSICGTTTDKVYEICKSRFIRVIKASCMIILQSLVKLGRLLNGNRDVIVTFNPLPYHTKTVVFISIPSNIKDPSILYKGEYIPLQCIGNLNMQYKCYVCTLSLPPMSIESINIISGHPKTDNFDLTAYGNVIENEYIKVIVNSNGSITLIDKRNNKSYDSINVLVDRGDAGDSYNYDPPDTDHVVKSSNAKGKIRLLEVGPHRACISVNLELRVPREVKNRVRSQKLVSLPINIKYIVYRGIPRVDVIVKVLNKAKDHVLRTSFPLINNSRIIRDLPFEFREAILQEPTKYATSLEYEPRNIVFRSWIGIISSKHGLVIATKGLHEAYVIGNNLEITLLRCFSSLSKCNLKTRKGHAGPPIMTPKAQYENEVLEFQYSILPLCESDIHEFKFIQHIESFLKPAIGIYIDKNVREGKHKNLSLSLLDLEPPLILSAFKLKEDNINEIIVRIFNPTSSAKSIKLKNICRIKCLNIFESKLSEKPTTVLDLTKEYIIQSFKIKTFIIRRDKQ